MIILNRSITIILSLFLSMSIILGLMSCAAPTAEPEPHPTYSPPRQLPVEEFQPPGNGIIPFPPEKEVVQIPTESPDEHVVEVALSPVSISAMRGTSVVFTLNIRPNGFGISGADLLFTFDHTAMKVSDLRLGELLGSDPQVVKRQIDNESGKLRLCLARVGETSPPTGSGALVIITLSILEEAQPGSRQLTLDRVNLADEQFDDIVNITTQNGSVQVLHDESSIPSSQEGTAISTELMPMDLGQYFNGYHTTYLKEFFPSEHVLIGDIPFRVKRDGVNMVETGITGKESIRIKISRERTKALYFIGYGTYLARQFGHKKLFCDKINHFSISISYSDGSQEEVFPKDVMLGSKEWADILRSEGAIAEFKALPVAYLHLYSININPAKQLQYIVINDKHEQAQYVIFALTLEAEIKK